MPAEQMFLLFDDGTAYEFYTTGILSTTGGIMNKDINGLYQYMKSNMEIYFQSIKDPDSDQHITGYINLDP